ncbi:hypothetical protein QUC31_017410 [Theobroma cacao]
MASLPPRVLIVSRRTVRKNKFVDFIGEYHLDLIVGYGAVPVIVPRVSGLDNLLDSFKPFHGVLLCEGEDIDPSLYETETSSLSAEELEEIKKMHAGDTAIDKEKDSIELKLAKLCLERNIPYFGICRGSQILNVACGGTLYQDIGKELPQKFPEVQSVSHMNYDNYDGHRHVIKLVENTPLYHWFKKSMNKKTMEIFVNSYHHQGVKQLARRFVPMAFAPDGLIEGFYDPEAYNPQEGKFLIGLQFHPERMRRPGSEEFDYPGCATAYKEFVGAAIAYQKKLFKTSTAQSRNEEEENNCSKFSLRPSKQFTVLDEAKFLKSEMSNATLTFQEEVRLMEVGATVRNSSSYFDKMKSIKGKEVVAKRLMGKMSTEHVSSLMSFYQMMGQICSEVLQTKLHGDGSELSF